MATVINLQRYVKYPITVEENYYPENVYYKSVSLANNSTNDLVLGTKFAYKQGGGKRIVVILKNPAGATQVLQGWFEFVKNPDVDDGQGNITYGTLANAASVIVTAADIMDQATDVTAVVQNDADKIWVRLVVPDYGYALAAEVSVLVA